MIQGASCWLLNDYDSFAGVGGGGTRTRGLYEAVGDWTPVVFVSFSNVGELVARRSRCGHHSHQCAQNRRTHRRSSACQRLVPYVGRTTSSPAATARPTLGCKPSIACCVNLRAASWWSIATWPACRSLGAIASSIPPKTTRPTLKQRLLEWHPLKAAATGRGGTH